MIKKRLFGLMIVLGAIGLFVAGAAEAGYEWEQTHFATNHRFWEEAFHQDEVYNVVATATVRATDGDTYDPETNPVRLYSATFPGFEGTEHVLENLGFTIRYDNFFIEFIEDPPPDDPAWYDHPFEFRVENPDGTTLVKPFTIPEKTVFRPGAGFQMLPIPQNVAAAVDDPFRPAISWDTVVGAQFYVVVIYDLINGIPDTEHPVFESLQIFDGGPTDENPQVGRVAYTYTGNILEAGGVWAISVDAVETVIDPVKPDVNDWAFNRASFYKRYDTGVGNLVNDSFVLLAADSIRLGKRTVVTDGRVAVINRAGHHRKHRSPVVWIDRDSFLGTDAPVYGDRVRIERGASIGNVFFNDLRNRGTIRDSQYTPLDLPLPIDLPEFPDPAPGHLDLRVKKGETRVLEPGAYGRIEIWQNATLVLTGGMYHVERLDLKNSNARIVFQAPSDLVIEGRFRAGNGSLIGPEYGADITPADIRIYVAGEDRRHGKRRGHPDARDDHGYGGKRYEAEKIRVGRQSTIEANIYAPYSTIVIDHGSTLDGALIGRNIVIGSDVQISLANGFPDSGFPDME